MCSDKDGDSGNGHPPFQNVAASIPLTPATADKSVKVDLALDATTSMEGYAHQGSTYGRFLDGLESALGSKWQNADIRFYRFGSRVDSIGRDGFRAARTDAAFYRVPGVFERTNIDSVLARTDAERVTVVVTDLFQTDDDKNSLVEQLKARAFQRGLAVGLVPVESAFDGRVFDAPGGAYTYASTEGDATTYRPFYMLVVGAAPVVARFFETIRGVEGVKPDQMLLVSPYVVTESSINLTKPPETKGLNTQGGGQNGTPARFTVRPGETGGRLTGRLSYNLSPYAAPLVADRLVMKAFRATGTDSVATDEIRLSNPRADGAGALAFDLDVNIDQPKGHYTYLLVFETSDLDGQAVPAWVQTLSSTNPTAASDANRTLNLDRFVADLVQASATVHAPRVAAAIIDINKKD